MLSQNIDEYTNFNNSHEQLETQQNQCGLTINSSEQMKNSQKINVLNKTFQKFKEASSKENLLDFFITQNKLSFGSILTTPTSGSKDIFIISSGKIMIFVPNRYVSQYEKKFIVLAILKEKTIFNESHILYSTDQFYGSMVVDEKTELLTLSKDKLPNVSDQNTLDILRDQCQAKDRLYKSILEKFKLLDPAELEKQQTRLLKNYELSLMEISEKIDQHIKNDLIYTTEAFTHQEINLQRFNQKVGKQQISYKKKGEVDQVGNHDTKILHATNRLVNRQRKGLTPCEQLSLMNLQNLAKSRREGKLEVSELGKNFHCQDISKFKNKMLDAVKNEDEIDIFENEPIIIQKKHFAEKKFAHCGQELNLKEENHKDQKTEKNLKKLSSTESEGNEIDDDWNVIIEKQDQIQNLHFNQPNFEDNNAKRRNINKTKNKLFEEI